MPPLLKARRTQEDGFDRGKPRTSGWWRRVATGQLLRFLCLVLVVAPHASHRDGRARFSGLQHAEAADEAAARATAGNIDDFLNAQTREHTTSKTGATPAASDAAGTVLADDGSPVAASPSSNHQQAPTPAQAFTFRALFRGRPDGLNGLDAVAVREHCPFAHDPDTPEAIDFWELTLNQGMIALGPPDAVHLTTREVYGALDALGTILTCCPGVLNPGGTVSGVDVEVDSEAPRGASLLPSCGLLDVNIQDGRDDDIFEGGEIIGSNAGHELTMMFSLALRAARLPSVALRALHDAEVLRMTASQRSAWEREMAMVLLQMGRVHEATVRLKSAIEIDPGDVRALQPLGAALLAQGAVAEGTSVWARYEVQLWFSGFGVLRAPGLLCTRSSCVLFGASIRRCCTVAQHLFVLVLRVKGSRARARCCRGYGVGIRDANLQHGEANCDIDTAVRELHRAHL